jgi:CRISPR Csm4 C-terminal domain
MWPALLFPKLGRSPGNGSQTADQDNQTSLYWLLSLYSPSSADTVDWAGGYYEPTLRGGRMESAVGSGMEKKVIRMISEGSVLAARADPTGVAIDVAPDGFAHPVYRSGLALALKLPDLNQLEQGPIEAPTAEDLEPRPCKDSEPERVEGSDLTTGELMSPERSRTEPEERDV